MRILHISTASTWRGGERQVHLLATGLVTQGVEVHVMCPSDSPLGEEISTAGIQVVPYYRGPLWQIVNAVKIAAYVRKHNVDLVHAHDSHAHTVVYLSYRMHLLTAVSVVSRRLTNPVSRGSYRKYNYPQIKKIICVSQAVKSTIISSIHDDSRLEVIYSGLPVEIDAYRSLYEDGGKIVVGYVAAFTTEKNHVAFAKIARALLTHSDRFYFLLVGEGPHRSDMELHVEDIQDHVRFTGHVADVDGAYRQMDVLLHTSDHEALGTSIIGAMAHGLPVVAQDVGGLSEVVHHEVTGYLYAAGDLHAATQYIWKIANNPSLRRELGNQGRMLAKNFTSQRMVEKTLAIYHDVLNGSIQE